MQLIPVIDLMRGEVVRAVRGQRSTYRPVRSALCEGSEPATVARAMLRACGAARLYVADLDALQGQPPQDAAVRAVLDALPAGIELWLDAGFARAADAPRDARIVPVLGSESLRSLDGIDAKRHVLSLDRRDGRPLDQAGCWATPQAWPERVIVMTLESVGAGSGPDLDTLRAVRAQAPRACLVGAGGLRDGVDVQHADKAGAWGWLVASALHDGRIDASMTGAPS